MQKVLVVVDMQNDFIDGALGTKEAVAIVPGVKEKIKNFDGVVFLPEIPTKLIISTLRKERSFLYRTASVTLKDGRSEAN